MTQPAKRQSNTQLRMSQLVEDFLFAKAASGRRPATIDCYRVRLSRLVTFLSDAPVVAVTSADIRNWLVDLKRGRKRTTTGTYVEGHRIVAGMFFAWLVRKRNLRRSPLQDVDKFLVDRPAVRTLTRDQIRLVLESQPNTPTGRRNRAMLAFMYDTGIRVAELTRLRLQDIDLASRLARIESKTRSLDVVPLSGALCRELRTYLREQRPASAPGTDALFTSRSGHPATANLIRLSLRRTKLRAGLDRVRVSPQVIRSSSATHLAAMGASAFEVQRFLRHTTVRMSQRYVNLAALDLARDSPFASLTNDRIPRRRASLSRPTWSRFGLLVAGTRSGDIGQLRSFRERGIPRHST